MPSTVPVWNQTDIISRCHSNRSMTVGKFIAEIEALVLTAKISGITSEQKIAVLHGIIDALQAAAQIPAPAQSTSPPERPW
jgi:hypothetical protein